ncbi:hypothetical protein [Escherichia coli]|uniref:hypothetical protein n=1 Tax=Escherichia coli TaxID=562 RepID=UPI0020336CC9|nr:hypothetical protein [Escherichia coli]
MIRCVCGKKIGPDPRNFNQRVSLGRNDLLIRTFPRGVDISGTSALGGTAGAAVGATAGSALGGGVRSNIVGAVGGAVIGGIAGAAIESSATKQTGMEYVVETENGNLMTIVQGKDPLFTQGSKVLVLYGNPSRIITDPRH